MDMTTMMLIGIIPTTLIILGGLLVMRAGKEETAERRFLLYLVSVSIVLLLIEVVAGLFSTDLNRTPGIIASSIISTAILGVLALILLHLPALKGLPRRQWLPYLALAVLLIGLLAIYAQNSNSMAYYVLPAALGLALIWALANRWQGLAIILAGFCLFYFVLSNSLAYASWFEQQMVAMPNWLRFPFGILIFAMPGIAVALSAVLVHTGLKRLWKIPNGSVQASVAMDAPGRPDERGVSPFTSENPPAISLTPVKRPGSRLSGALRLALAFMILGALAYTIFWSSVWDQTSDGMGGLFYMMLAALVGVGAGAVMGINAKSWFRLSGFVFALTVPALMVWAFNYGWEVPFAGITDDSAVRIQTAIEDFYSRAGRYPSTLNELTPRDLLYVPQPVMFRGEGWCYQGGAEYYRFGTFYHEYFERACLPENLFPSRQPARDRVGVHRAPGVHEAALRPSGLRGIRRIEPQHPHSGPAGEEPGYGGENVCEPMGRS